MSHRRLRLHTYYRNIIIVLTLALIALPILYQQSMSIWIGLVLINLYTLLLMKLDKSYARDHHHFRIPEQSFYILGLCFGSLGILFGMSLFHHKTKHSSFRLIPLFIPFHIIVIVLLFNFIQ